MFEKYWRCQVLSLLFVRKSYQNLNSSLEDPPHPPPSRATATAEWEQHAAERGPAPTGGQPNFQNPRVSIALAATPLCVHKPTCTRPRFLFVAPRTLLPQPQPAALPTAFHLAPQYGVRGRKHGPRPLPHLLALSLLWCSRRHISYHGKVVPRFSTQKRMGCAAPLPGEAPLLPQGGLMSPPFRNSLQDLQLPKSLLHPNRKKTNQKTINKPQSQKHPHPPPNPTARAAVGLGGCCSSHGTEPKGLIA